MPLGGEEVLEWFNYPCTYTLPGCKVLLNRPAMAALLHRQPDSREIYIVLESELTRSLVAKLPQHSCILVREFPAAGEERCEQGYGWV